MLQQMQIAGLMEGRLILEQRSRVHGGQTRHFVVPRLAMNNSAIEIMSGSARVNSLQEAVTQALPIAIEEQIVDAEIIEEVEGWDKPPTGTAVKKNPNPPPKYLPA
jgi:hypothetical protein